MERLFESFDRHIENKLEGQALTSEQALVLSYLIKSEWANEKLGYTILLTPDNNHFAALLGLEKAGLITKHSLSTAAYPIYIADRALVVLDYLSQLRAMFGAAFDALDPTAKEALGVVYRHNHFSKVQQVSAKQVSYALWYAKGGSPGDIEQFDTFYRKIRSTFNKLEKVGFVKKLAGTRGYVLREDFVAPQVVAS